MVAEAVNLEPVMSFGDARGQSDIQRPPVGVSGLQNSLKVSLLYPESVPLKQGSVALYKLMPVIS